MIDVTALDREALARAFVRAGEQLLQQLHATQGLGQKGCGLGMGPYGQGLLGAQLQQARHLADAEVQLGGDLHRLHGDQRPTRGPRSRPRR